MEPKIFGVGFNKTGTRTLIEALEILDLGPAAKPQVLHDAYPELGDYPYRAICDGVFDGDPAMALEIAREFRSFKDRPWNVAPMYRVLDEAFPGSKFILTWREPDLWWRSVEKWLAREEEGKDAKVHRYLRHIGTDAIDRDAFLTGYAAHNAEVRGYFAGRDDYLELNWEAGDGWSELCGFLGVAVPDATLPHANRQEHGA